MSQKIINFIKFGVVLLEKVLEGLERDFRQLSREINKHRQYGKLDPFVGSFFRKYSGLVFKLSPFCPRVCNDS